MEAAAREGEEEAGVKVGLSDMTFSTVMHRIEDEERVDFFVLVHQWHGEIFNAEPEKCDELRWVDVNALPTNTVPYVRQALRNHQNGVPFDECKP